VSKTKAKAPPPPKPQTADELFAAITALRVASPSEFAELIDRLASEGIVRVAQGFIQ
jgi:hypothetical protein